MCNAMIIGGAFDNNKGRAFGFVDQLSKHTGWFAKNGGKLSALVCIDYDKFDALVWMPQTNPSSDNAFQMAQDYKFSLLDPLGKQYCDTASVADLAQVLKNRVQRLCSENKLQGYGQSSFAFREAGFLLVFRRQSGKADAGTQHFATGLFAKYSELGKRPVVVPIQLGVMKYGKETGLAICGRIYVKGAPVALKVSRELVEGFGNRPQPKGEMNLRLVRRSGMEPEERGVGKWHPLTNAYQALAC